MLFSVIVPVFNAKLYLIYCVESIRNQSLKEWELILVDDGSVDGSEKICDNFAAKDNRIRVIHQKNRGVTNARYTGIMEAKGQYVLYVDADDWIDRELLAEAYEVIKNKKIDSVSFGFKYIYEDGREDIKYEPVPAGLYNKKEISTIIYPQVLLGTDMRNMFYSIAGRVIRRSLLLKIQTDLPENLSMGEDTICSLKVYMAVSNIYISDNPRYCYRIHSSSVSHHFDISLYNQFEATIKYLDELNIKEIPNFSEQINRYVMLVLFCAMLIGIEDNSWDEISEICNAMKRPVFRKHLEKAKFNSLTTKTKITYWFYKKNMIKSAWYFLLLCNCLKKGWRSERINKKSEKKNTV